MVELWPLRVYVTLWLNCWPSMECTFRDWKPAVVAVVATITATTATNHPNPAPAVSGSETVHDPPTILTFAPFLVIMINLQTLDLKILNPFPSFPSSSKNNFTSPYPLVDVWHLPLFNENKWNSLRTSLRCYWCRWSGWNDDKRGYRFKRLFVFATNSHSLLALFLYLVTFTPLMNIFRRLIC